MAFLGVQTCLSTIPAAAQAQPPELLRRRGVSASDYPYESRMRGEEGDVRLRLRVDPTGMVEHIDILEGSGFPALDTAALLAAANWRFRPALRDGEPLTSTIVTAIRFRLKQRGHEPTGPRR